MRKDAKRIKKDIIAIYNSDGNKPVNVALEHSKLYHTACKIFGSWRTALSECGIDYLEARNNEKWSKERILKAIRGMYVQGKSLQPSRLRNNGNMKLLSAANYHFGSWRRAVESCGYEYVYGRERKVSKRNYISEGD